MRIEVILALLYPVAVGLALFGILRWAKRERARLMRQRPGARLINGSAEIVRGHLTDGLKLFVGAYIKLLFNFDARANRNRAPRSCSGPRSSFVSLFQAPALARSCSGNLIGRTDALGPYICSCGVRDRPVCSLARSWPWWRWSRLGC